MGITYFENGSLFFVNDSVSRKWEVFVKMGVCFSKMGVYFLKRLPLLIKMADDDTND